jgi:hypothetical protein
MYDNRILSTLMQANRSSLARSSQFLPAFDTYQEYANMGYVGQSANCGGAINVRLSPAFKRAIEVSPRAHDHRSNREARRVAALSLRRDCRANKFAVSSWVSRTGVFFVE